MVMTMRESRLLVADNSAGVQSQIRTTLSDWLVQITPVFDGREAVELANSCVFDLVLMDTCLPIVNGFQAASAIRSSKNVVLKKLPIIALVSRNLQEEIKNCRNAGMNESLGKPLEVNRLIRTMSRWIPMAKRSQMSFSPVEARDGFFVTQDFDKFDYLPGISLIKTLENLGGDISLYLILLEQYVEEKWNIASLIRQNLMEGRIKEACILVHGMKGVTSTLGLEELSQVCCRLEEALLHGEHGVSCLLDSFEAAQAVVLGSIDTLTKKLQNSLS